MRIFLFLTALALATSLQAGALQDYVQRPDPVAQWSLRTHSDGPFVHAWFFDLISQQWLDSTRVDRPVWTHEVRIMQPRPWLCRPAPQPHTALLIISGGSNRAFPANSLSTAAALVARLTCRTLVEIRQVPNEPLLFGNHGEPRKEDAILAYAFDQFLRGDPADWPAQMPMVKAVVRTMDLVQTFSRQNRDLPTIDRFVLLGTSKRGWTAWLTAAVDPRVQAIIAASIDMPNLPAQLPHQFAAYGDYGRALNDYKAFDIACRLHSQRGEELLDIVDPMRYLDHLGLPKYLLNSAGDEFFPSDSSRFYYAQLPGEKRLRYTVNTDHRQTGKDSDLVLFEEARNWINAVLGGHEPPDLAWHVENADPAAHTEVLAVTPTGKPRRVRLWTADNPNTRDFRKETLGPVWKSVPLQPDPDGVYRARLTTPAKGWRAALVEAEFGGWRQASRQVYSTDVFVLPETLPYSGNPCRHGAGGDALTAPPNPAPGRP